ncbi:MAG: DUF4345 domain-containing protein [Gammaproteobacteria bacterium]|nr:DUF4345 domain-containing protein [Gammaproteobacteria bacterium]
MAKVYLIFTSILIIPIALIYGISPVKVLPLVLEITVEGTDQIHIFRAMMCLYIGMGLFWFMSAFQEDWIAPAVITTIFFAGSLVLGRLLSFIVDGIPSLLLIIYIVLEAIMIPIALFVYKKHQYQIRNK